MLNVWAFREVPQRSDRQCFRQGILAHYRLEWWQVFFTNSTRNRGFIQLAPGTTKNDDGLNAHPLDYPPLSSFSQGVLHKIEVAIKQYLELP
jgi:hypothetical protein